MPRGEGLREQPIFPIKALPGADIAVVQLANWVSVCGGGWGGWVSKGEEAVWVSKGKGLSSQPQKQLLCPLSYLRHGHQREEAVLPRGEGLREQPIFPIKALP